MASFVDDHEGRDFLAAAESRGLRTLALPSGNRAALRELKDFVVKNDVRLICTHGYKADVLGILAARKSSVRVAAFLRGWTAQNSKVRIYEAIDRRMLSRANAVVGLSQTQTRKLNAPEGKRHTVTNVIESRIHSQEATAKAKKELQKRFNLGSGKIVASAGRLSPEKGTRYFVAAANILAKEFPDTEFIIFGDGTEKQSLQSSVQAGTRLTFAGHTNDFTELLPGVDLLVNPSLMEEMPNVVLEAMASGVPVVATAVGGVPEIAGPEPVLALVQPGDPGAIVGATRQMLIKPDQASRWANRARQRIATDYSPERQRVELGQLFKKLIPGFQSVTPTNTESPFISIAMPVRNEEQYIESVISALLEQDYPADKFEIIVADGESTDQTRAIVTKCAQKSRVPIRLFPNPRRLSSAARNVGITNAKGEIVAFVDGHCTIPDKSWLRNIADIFQETNALALCRPQPLDDGANSVFQTMIAKCRGSALGHGLDSSIFALSNECFINPTSAGAIYRKEVFDRVGMYDENFDACEDVELNHRVWKAALPAYISPRLAVLYAPRKDLRGLFKQMSRYGYGRAKFIAKHSDAVSIGQLIPPGFVLWLLMGAALSFFIPLIGYMLLVTVAIYLAAVTGFSIRLALKEGARFLWGGPLIYPTIHFGLGLGFWKGVFAPKKIAQPASAKTVGTSC